MHSRPLPRGISVEQRTTPITPQSLARMCISGSGREREVNSALIKDTSARRAQQDEELVHVFYPKPEVYDCPTCDDTLLFECMLDNDVNKNAVGADLLCPDYEL